MGGEVRERETEIDWDWWDGGGGGENEILLEFPRSRRRSGVVQITSLLNFGIERGKKIE